MNKKLIHIILLCSIFFISCGLNKNKLPPLKETYSYNDKNPFGSFILHHQISQLYTDHEIVISKKNFVNNGNEVSDTNSLYINVSKNFYLSPDDLSAALEFVQNGNIVFLSSENIDTSLLHALGCEVSEPSDASFEEMENTFVSLSSNFFSEKSHFQYFYVPFINHFTKVNSSRSKILGSNKKGPDFIVVFYGKGRFYLHTEPRAFSNYFLLQKENYKYTQQSFSLTPSNPENIYWDDYYNKKNHPDNDTGNQSGLSVLLKHPAMAWAFYLLLAMFILYIIFGAKRRQRIVEPIVPNLNTTVIFTETVGRLYLQKKDNLNIAEKIIAYFFENVRTKYFLNTSIINDEMISTLSRKSNNSQEGTATLFQLINTIQQSMEISDHQLLSLNQQIEKFYKNNL